MPDEYSPDHSSPPGDTIADLMDEQGVSIDELGDVLDLSFRACLKLLQGEVEITPEIASSLSGFLGSTPEFWLKREKIYRDSLPNTLTNFQRLTIHLMTVKAVPADGSLADGLNFLMDAQGIANTAEECIKETHEYCDRVRVQIPELRDANDEVLATEIMRRINLMKNRKDAP